MATTSSTPQREGKYTQGFVFEHGHAGGVYARTLVERSCAAVVTLLQDVFAVAEKTAFQQALAQSGVTEQNRAFSRLADIIRYRATLERSLTSAIACAYASFAEQDNHAQIEQRMLELEKLRCESVDLLTLFCVPELIEQTTNRNRPLLLDFSAQLALLFDAQAKHIGCNPLSPATLVSGYLVGLMCTDMDILSKQLLFRVFEQEFLAKLSMLMNSIILRLEQENVLVKHIVSFEDKDAGPIGRILDNPGVLSIETVQQAINHLHHSLSAHQQLPLARHLYELSGEDALDSAIQLLSDSHYYYANMQTAMLRSTLNAVETGHLVEARTLIANKLNTAFDGKQMPQSLKVFFQTLWPEVLFDLFVIYGDGSEVWQDAMRLQDDLVASVTPATSVEDTQSLSRLIPRLIRELRRLLDETGCSFQDITTFLGELKLLHLQNMHQTLDSTPFVPWSVLSFSDTAPVCEKILDEDEEACYMQLRDMVSLLACR